MNQTMKGVQLHYLYNNNNNNNNCLKSNIQCIEIRVQWTVYMYLKDKNCSFHKVQID